MLSKLTLQKQDPKAVEEVIRRVAEILMAGEQIEYVAVQADKIINWFPDCVVLTQQRLILYRPKLLGRVSFEDHMWMHLRDAQLEENIIGSTLSFAISTGGTLSMSWLPKDQARALYRFAQEREREALETRRQRRMEEDRARAGGVNIQTNVGIPPAPSVPSHTLPPPQADDPVVSLTKLKSLLDAGLVTQAEFDAKKAEILKRL